MPPQRTFPPVKPVKTERTHEENQERAYIAASRRSDRSLEARVESARRASDIHKRRTGRSLRVTEQDVINEEMYEEEDDDLPSQYRRLTAHLQTGSADFNRRLAAYLTNHVAMRSALSEALNGNFSQHFPNAPQFAHNNSMFPSPLMTQGFAPQPQHQMQSPTQMSPHSPHPYRQTPYPMPGQQQYRPNQHPRAMSMQMPPQTMQQAAQIAPAPATPGAQLPSQHAPEPFRRASMPGPGGSTFVQQHQQASPQQLPSPRSEASPRAMTPLERPASKPGSAPASVVNGPISQQQVPLHQPQPQHPVAPAQQLVRQQHIVPSQPQFQRQGRPQSINIPDNNLAPFTMSLAPNDAAIVNPSALPQNAFGAALMGNDLEWNPSFDNSVFGASDPGSMLKPGANFHPNLVGMNTTLAPEEMLKIGSGHYDMNVTTPLNFDMGTFINFSDNSNGPSAAGTPGDVGVNFGDFVDNAWGETT